MLGILSKRGIAFAGETEIDISEVGKEKKWERSRIVRIERLVGVDLAGNPVSRSRSVTSAPMITTPLESFTVPGTVAVLV